MKKMICFMLVFVMATSIPMMSIAAKSQSELQSDLNTTQQEIKEAEAEQEQVQQQLSEAMQDIAELSTQIQNYEVEIGTLNSQIRDLEENLAETQKNLEEAEDNCEEQEELLKERLIVLYEAGEYSYLDVLFNSTSLVDLISNYYLITEIAESDTEMLQKLEDSKKQIEYSKQVLEGDKAELEKAKETKVAKSQALESAKSEKNKQVAALNDEEKALQEKIDQYQKDVEDLEEQIRKAATTTNSEINSSYNGSGMIWPTPNCRYITSPYGSRIHPVYGYQGFHTGMDIGANNRSAVVAVQDGVVSLASWNGGYGNCVMINHGGGISTLYGHGSKIVVKAGQTVKQGDVIMYVGSTGVSSGPHLHFEVRKNGSHVEPSQYLP